MISRILPLFSLATVISAACPPNADANVRRIIIDQDAGGDDAWGLLMLLMNEREYNVCVQAITCTHGNTDIDNVAKNVARTLAALDRTDIPVYRGASERLITPAPTREGSGYFWGMNGFGDVRFNSTPSLAVISEGHAVLQMRELIQKYPKQITILCTGPLTNLAMLFKLFPEVKGNIADIFILGGNRHGVGNTDFTAEFNFYDDPEAANIVVNNAPVVLNIFPWETILDLERVFPINWRMETFRDPRNEAIEMLNAVEAVVYANITGWTPCDMYLAAVVLDHGLIRESARYRADVELNGKITRGMLGILYHEHDEDQFNVNIIDGVDEDTLMQMVVDLNRGLDENGVDVRPYRDRLMAGFKSKGI